MAVGETVSRYFRVVEDSLLPKDDLAASSLDDDGSDRGAAWADDDRERVVAEPGGEASGIRVENESCDRGRPGGVADGGASGQRRPWRPLDEEGVSLSGSPAAGRAAGGGLWERGFDAELDERSLATDLELDEDTDER